MTNTGLIKHATASAYIFHHDRQHGWRTGLIEHPLLGRWMQAGGHVESDENPEEAALREVAEETGLTGFRRWDPNPSLRVATDDPVVALPCWIMEHRIERDNHLDRPHIHIDHKYVVISDDDSPVTEPAHPFRWWNRTEIEALSTFEDVRQNLLLLFGLLTSHDPTISEKV